MHPIIAEERAHIGPRAAGKNRRDQRSPVVYLDVNRGVQPVPVRYPAADGITPGMIDKPNVIWCLGTAKVMSNHIKVRHTPAGYRIISALCREPGETAGQARRYCSDIVVSRNDVKVCQRASVLELVDSKLVQG